VLDLARTQQALTEDYRGSLENAAVKLLALRNWTLEATVVLINPETRAVSTGPVPDLSIWLDHSPTSDVMVSGAEMC
jgi:hypothetical protein